MHHFEYYLNLEMVYLIEENRLQWEQMGLSLEKCSSCCLLFVDCNQEQIQQPVNERKAIRNIYVGTLENLSKQDNELFPAKIKVVTKNVKNEQTCDGSTSGAGKSSR